MIEEVGLKFHLSSACKPSTVNTDGGGCRPNGVGFYCGGGNWTKEACLRHSAIR